MTFHFSPLRVDCLLGLGVWLSTHFSGITTWVSGNSQNRNTAPIVHFTDIAPNPNLMKVSQARNLIEPLPHAKRVKTAARVQSQSEKQPRSWKSSALTPRGHSARAPLTSPLKSKVKSGYSLFPTASAIHSNRRRSTHGDTPWISGCIPSSVSGIWPTSPTSP